MMSLADLVHVCVWHLPACLQERRWRQTVWSLSQTTNVLFASQFRNFLDPVVSFADTH